MGEGRSEKAKIRLSEGANLGLGAEIGLRSLRRFVSQVVVDQASVFGVPALAARLQRRRATEVSGHLTRAGAGRLCRARLSLYPRRFSMVGSYFACWLSSVSARCRL